MSSTDSSLYGKTKVRNISNGKEISTSTTLAFTSQLSSLITSASSSSTHTTSKARAKKQRKDDIFSIHNRNASARAARDHIDSAAFAQRHTTSSEGIDAGTWERSRRRMEEKARLYAAMQRGDVEDTEERYAVDFDRKWAEGRDGVSDAEDDDGDEEVGDEEQVEYTDEFGRTRTGTRWQAARAERVKQGLEEDTGREKGTGARPVAPSNVIRGDTIQHAAFEPDADVATAMATLAAKRDRSLTPPPAEHFDARREVRTKGTGFFQFSGNEAERKRQMEGLDAERAETERVRAERARVLEERRKVVEERRNEILKKRGKRKADEFLEELGQELMGGSSADRRPVMTTTGTDLTARIEEAVQRENDVDDER